MTPVDERFHIASNSPKLLAHPAARDSFVMISRLDNPDFGCAVHVSGDGGRGWLPANPVPQLPAGAEKCYSPDGAFDPEGNLVYLFVGLQGAGNNPMGALLVTSTGDGYSKPMKVLGPERYMVRLAVNPESGRIHLVWLEATSDPPLGGLGPPPNPIMSAYSDDGGRTWSKPVQVNDPQRQRVVAPAVALGAKGEVHVLYYDLRDDSRDYQGLEGPVWEGNWSLAVSTSTDGGRTFGQHSEVDAGLVPPERVMLIYTMAPPALAAGGDGSLHAAWHDARNGDWDVFHSRSSDLGRTWSKPRRLNDDPLRNGRHQYLPQLSWNMRLDAIFYDRRDDPANMKNNVYFTSSRDGGATFTPNLRVTREPSDSEIGPRYPIPSAAGMIEIGSRIALTSGAGSALAAWTDTRNSEVETYQQEIFATTILVGEEQRRLPLTAAAWVASAAVLGVLLGALGLRRVRRPGRDA